MAGGKQNTKQRKVAVGRYASFKLQKRIKPSGQHLPSAFQIFRKSIGLIKKNWKTLGGIALWYGIANILLIQSVSTSDVSNAKQAFSSSFNGTWGDLTAGAGSFLYLIGLSGNVASAAGAYQLLLIIISSLAIMYALRRMYIDKAVYVREAFYEGMYALIPFAIVMLVIALQLVPLVVGGSLFSTVMNNGITAGAAEVVAWAALFFLLTLLSLYMVASSIFALYAVSLPHMAPLKALRAVRKLVNHRRWEVMRKVLFLPLMLLIVSAIVLVPLIMLAPPAVAWMFYVLMVVFVVVIHSYLYTLYRLLLQD